MFKKIWSFLIGRGFSYKVKKDWPGEAGLPYPNREPDISKETIEKEIWDSLNKKEAGHG